MPDLPSGTVTFLFTDIEGSTPLWEGEPERMRAALAQHNAILRQAIDGQRGYVFKVIGDAFQAAFARPADALAAALAAQGALEAAEWPTSTPLRVRMGLHTGPAEPDGAEYAVAHTLNRVARIMAAAHGGQVVLSVDVTQLLQGDLPPDCRLRDLGQHRMKGMTQREHLYQLMAPGLPAGFPPLATLDALPNNLPVQLTSFIGREREIAEVRARLTASPGAEPRHAEPAAPGWREHSAEAVRLLTLIGPGGTGKTRLSLQVAAELLPEYPDGAWLVELAPLADPAYLAPALAAVFGAREQAGQALLDVVIDYLRAKRMLLILDNCEHLIDACARLADDLLHACPGVKILASSREALGLAGETAYRVPSLALPGAQAAATPDSLTRCEAARLFVERAQAAQPRFALTASNAPAVAALCRRLDGIPLALELAAARVRMLPVEQIVARLDDRFRLLVGGSRTALPRQQTLRALIDWSYDLLPDAERRLLRQLSVFAGGATLEAIEAVGKSELDVLDLLTQLVNKSLVVVEEDGPAARYRLLETIRQYAREKLLDDKGGEAEAARKRHLAYFADWAEAAEPRLTGAEMIAALDELEADQDNLRAALEWALDHDPLAALRLMGVLWWLWGRRTSLTEGRQLAAAALAAADTAEAASVAAEPASLLSGVAARARVLEGQAWMENQLGDNQASRAAATASMALARQAGAQRTLASALVAGAAISYFVGDQDNAPDDLARAQAWAQEAIVISRQHGYLYEQSMAVSISLLLTPLQDQQPVPPALRAETLRVARATRNPWAIAFAIRLAAHVDRMTGAFEAAYAGYAESAAIYQQMRDRNFYNASRSEMGHVLRLQGRHAAAAAIYAETMHVWQELGQRAAVAHELECLACMAAAGGPAAAPRAAQLFGAAEILREQIGSNMTAMERREYDQGVAQLRAQLEAAGLTAAWASGRTMGLDEAVAYALAEGPESSVPSRYP